MDPNSIPRNYRAFYTKSYDEEEAKKEARNEAPTFEESRVLGHERAYDLNVGIGPARRLVAGRKACFQTRTQDHESD